jgi:hypothetical protein
MYESDPSFSDAINYIKGSEDDDESDEGVDLTDFELLSSCQRIYGDM